MPTQLSDSDLKEIAEKINDGIEELSIKTLRDKPRTHLGISEIGEPCMRQLYYKFRWCFFQEFDGRMLRLFKRGHREEERYVSYLEGIGCKVDRFEASVLNYHPESDNYFYSSEFDPGDGLVHDVTGYPDHEKLAAERGIKPKQFRVSGVMGHYGGSCDGRVITPWLPDKMLLECKTHNTKSFCKYISDGLHKSKPMHYDQMCGYGWKMDLHYGIYFPENKNDDEIKVSVIRLDHQRGMQLERKAEEIITAKEPPPKISENPAFFNCKYCDAKEICHEGKIPLKNCRSCRLSTPVENAEWHCSRFNSNIPAEYIAAGCDGWVPI